MEQTEQKKLELKSAPLDTTWDYVKDTKSSELSTKAVVVTKEIPDDSDELEDSDRSSLLDDSDNELNYSVMDENIPSTLEGSENVENHSLQGIKIKSEPVVKMKSKDSEENINILERWLPVEVKEKNNCDPLALVCNDNITFKRNKDQISLEISDYPGCSEQAIQTNANASFQKEQFLENLHNRNFTGSRKLTLTAEVIPEENISVKNHDDHLSNFNYDCNFQRGSKTIPELYVCDICDKVCLSPTRLKQHMMVHSEARPYRCEFCQKTFARNQYLRRHILTHQNKRHHHCESCPKAFLRNSDLQRHILTHTKEKPYACDLCKKAFTQNSSLKRHKVTHTNQAPYACDFCAKKFRSTLDVQKHLAHYLCQDRSVRLS